jgi:small-conductance mechanosensitive channel
MKPIHLQLIESVILLLLLLAGNMIFRTILNRIDKKLRFALERKRIIYKIIHLFIAILALVGLIGIWGVDPKQLFLFLTSILTILAVGFFAQWSILSNITASLILFFNHPIHIGGYIKIMDKDLPIEGIVENITIFFLYIRTNEGELLSIPNILVLQKTISSQKKLPGKIENREI